MLLTTLLLLIQSAPASMNQFTAGMRASCSASRPSAAVSMGLFDSIRQTMNEIESTSGRKSAYASHILMKSREQALLLKEQIDAGGISFSDAARQYSSCPSAGKGGSLGQFGPGQMAPAFDALVFDPDTAVGDVNVCSTTFGTHLVKVIERSGVDQTAPAELAAKVQAAAAAAAAAEAAAVDPLRAAAEAAAEAAAVAEVEVQLTSSTGSGGPPRPPSARDRMAKLKDLLSADLITQDEFDAKRQAIIDSI